MRLPSLLLLLAAAATPGAPPAATDPLAPLFAPALGETRAALILRDGRVVEKRYAPGYGDANRFVSWSMAKTITAVLVGALVTDGKLSLDAPAPIAEWHAHHGDPRARITLRDLLTMSSGLRHAEVGDPVEASDTNQVEFVWGTDAMAAAAIAQPLAARPGTVWNYSTLTADILAEIVTRTLTPSHDPRVRARAYTAFAQARLFGPAGITSAAMDFDGAGTQVGGSLIYLTLDDWGRFGTLLLDGRGPGGAPVIAPAWLATMRRPAATVGNYGALTWLNRPPHPGGPIAYPGAPGSAISAEGHLGQHIVAVPEYHLVVVRLGHTNEGDIPRVHHAIGAIIREQIVPEALNGFAPREPANVTPPY